MWILRYRHDANQIDKSRTWCHLVPRVATPEETDNLDALSFNRQSLGDALPPMQTTSSSKTPPSLLHFPGDLALLDHLKSVNDVVIEPKGTAPMAVRRHLQIIHDRRLVDLNVPISLDFLPVFQHHHETGWQCMISPSCFVNGRLVLKRPSKSIPASCRLE
jgi:hypothetical protein